MKKYVLLSLLTILVHIPSGPGQVPSNKMGWELIRKDDYVEIHYSLDNKSYQVVREAYFPPKVKCKIGVMAAAPEGKGFQAVFEDFKIAAGHQ